MRKDHALKTAGAFAISTGSGAAAGAVFGGWPGAVIGAGIGAGVSAGGVAEAGSPDRDARGDEAGVCPDGHRRCSGKSNLRCGASGPSLRRGPFSFRSPCGREDSSWQRGRASLASAMDLRSSASSVGFGSGGSFCFGFGALEAAVGEAGFVRAEFELFFADDARFQGERHGWLLGMNAASTHPSFARVGARFLLISDLGEEATPVFLVAAEGLFQVFKDALEVGVATQFAPGGVDGKPGIVLRCRDRWRGEASGALRIRRLRGRSRWQVGRPSRSRLRQRRGFRQQ